MNKPVDFLDVLHRLADYTEAVLLHALIAQGACKEPFRTTVTKVFKLHAYGILSKTQIQRASARLVKKGLLLVTVHPKTWTEYLVPREAFEQFLAEPLPSNLPGRGEAQEQSLPGVAGVLPDAPSQTPVQSEDAK
jgi:hypothetical protein